MINKELNQVSIVEGTVHMELTQGQITTLDYEDYIRPEISGHRWYAHWDSSTKSFYCERTDRSTKKQKQLKLHRVILGVTDSKMYCDHINHDTLNNRKSNIRIATPSQNGMNKRKQSSNISGIAGVSWHTRDNKWTAQITINRKRIHLGYFDNKQDASTARQEAEIKYFGEFRKKE